MSWDKSKGRPEPIRSLNRIAEQDNGEPLVPLAEACPSVKVIRPSVIPYLRKSVAAMLEQAAQSLAPEYGLGVVDAWRPFERQVRIYEWMAKNLDEARPELTYPAKRRILCRFVAPVDQKAPPGHTTGGAVDVYLVNPQGETVDTTSPYPRLRGAPTYVFGLNPEAEANRMKLVEAMLNAGFSNCRDEWWHYSYGDAGWAVRTDRRECFYGRIDMPEDVYREQMDAWEEMVRKRGNPFLGAY